MPGWPKPEQRWGRVGWRACRVAAVRIEESAEDRSWDGAEGGGMKERACRGRRTRGIGRESIALVREIPCLSFERRGGLQALPCRDLLAD